MIDITIALVIFCVKFGWLLSLVIFIVMLLYGEQCMVYLIVADFFFSVNKHSPHFVAHSN